MPIIAEQVIPGMFLPQLTALRDVIFDRVLPAFDQLDSEANEIEREALARLEANATEYSDGADLAEAALEAGLEHFELMTDTQQTVMNSFSRSRASSFRLRT